VIERHQLAERQECRAIVKASGVGIGVPTRSLAVSGGDLGDSGDSGVSPDLCLLSSQNAYRGHRGQCYASARLIEGWPRWSSATGSRRATSSTAAAVVERQDLVEGQQLDGRRDRAEDYRPAEGQDLAEVERHRLAEGHRLDGRQQLAKGYRLAEGWPRSSARASPTAHRLADRRQLDGRRDRAGSHATVDNILIKWACRRHANEKALLPGLSKKKEA
jgi:hypothetical protein